MIQWRQKGFSMRFLTNALKRLAGEPVGVQLSQSVYDNWTTDAEFILDNKFKYGDGKSVGRFAYNPKTGELVWGDRITPHSALVYNQASSPFEEFVRGVYDGYTIMLRWYGTDPHAGSDVIKAQSFDAWWDTKQMLEANGLPAGMEVQLGVSTADIRQEVGREWGYR